MTAWPSIRAPLKDGWQGASPDGVRRTQMDAGPDKERLESTAAPAIENFQFRLTSADAATLDAFYAANKGGALFDLTHWIWGSVKAQFAGAIKWAASGPYLNATVQLSIYR